MVIGTLDILKDESAALKAIAALRRDININDARLRAKPLTLAELVEHYRQRELATENEWKTLSTRTTYEGYLRKWIVPRWGATNLNAIRAIDVENFYNVAQRNDDAFIDDLAAQGIAYVLFFPLGGFTPLQSSALDAAAASLKATPMQVALAWLLQRSPNILLIPGTSSLAHLRENLQSALLQIPPEVIADLDAIGTRPTRSTSRRSAAVHRGKVASG
jgi:diketogulonate reductase-like aldo/keto reductase